MSKALKTYLADDLKARLGDERDMVMVQLDRLSVEKANDLRNRLRDHGARMTVIRNRIAKLAFTDLGIGEIADLMDGMSAVAFGGEDGVLAVSKTLAEWSKKNKEGGIKIVGGYMEGKLLTAAEVGTLATLPSRDGLLAMIASAVAAPMQQIAAQMNELLAGVARAVGAVAEQKQGQDQ